MNNPNRLGLAGCVVFAALACALQGCGQSVAAGTINAAPQAQLATDQERAFYALVDARLLGQVFAMSNPTDMDTVEMSCVVRSMEGNTTVVRGTPCPNGPRLEGELRVTGDPLSSEGSFVEYRDWKSTSRRECMGATVANTTTIRGSSRVTARGNVREFELDLLIIGVDAVASSSSACAPSAHTIAISYRGSLDFFGPGGVQRRVDAHVRASGSGTISTTRFGRVETTTTSLVFDPGVCATEPASGTLDVRGVRALRVSYDGASRCGMGIGRTAPYTVDGVAGGEINVALCSVLAPGSAKLSWWGAIALVVGAMVIGRRRL